jgi:hypothetical protein
MQALGRISAGKRKSQEKRRFLLQIRDMSWTAIRATAGSCMQIR